MLESPIYPEIDKLFSFYGLELDDLAILLGVFMVVEAIVGQAHAHVASVDLTLYLTIVSTGILFMLWRAFKQGRPRHFLEDALSLLAEPDIAILTQDREIRPSYIIEPNGNTTLAPADRGD